jgi:hypothetical protein
MQKRVLKLNIDIKLNIWWWVCKKLDLSRKGMGQCGFMPQQSRFFLKNVCGP